MTEPNSPPPETQAAAGGARKGGHGRTVLVVGAAVLAGAAAGALALYGMKGAPGNAPEARPAQNTAVADAGGAAAGAKDPSCAPAVDRAQALKGLAKGEVAAFSPASEPRRLPQLSFADADGKPVTLADFKGKTLLVNLWATWCVPCRKEMPALDQLERTLGSDRFQVLALNLDTKDPAKPKAFLAEIGVSSLAFYADPGTKSFQALRAVGRGFGLPTTLLVDGDGCELGFLAGPAEWASEDAQALVEAALAPGG